MPPTGSIRSLQNLFLLWVRDYPILFTPLSLLRQKPDAYTAEKWNQEYIAGKWRFLHDLAEATHYHIIAGYVKSLKPNRKILDVGCGEGMLQTYLHTQGYSFYHGIDISSAAIEMAAPRANATTSFQLATAENYTSPEKYDAIILNETLYYMQNPARTLAQLRPLLAPGGIFIVSMALCGLRNALLKLHIWRQIYATHTLIDEATLFTRHGPSWIIAALKPE